MGVSLDAAHWSKMGTSPKTTIGLALNICSGAYDLARGKSRWGGGQTKDNNLLLLRCVLVSLRGTLSYDTNHLQVKPEL